jgi:hypothetical protein
MLQLPPRRRLAAPMTMTSGRYFANHPFGPCSGPTRDGEVRA